MTPLNTEERAEMSVKRQWIAIGIVTSALVTISIAGGTFAVNDHGTLQGHSTALKVLDKRMDAQDVRMSRLEDKIDRLPDRIVHAWRQEIRN